MRALRDCRRLRANRSAACWTRSSRIEMAIFRIAIPAKERSEQRPPPERANPELPHNQSAHLTPKISPDRPLIRLIRPASGAAAFAPAATRSSRQIEGRVGATVVEQGGRRAQLPGKETP
jgi:hypothetical protein